MATAEVIHFERQLHRLVLFLKGIALIKDEDFGGIEQIRSIRSIYPCSPGPLAKQRARTFAKPPSRR